MDGRAQLNVVKGTLSSPIILPVIVGLILTACSVPQPEIINTFLTLIGEATGGTALFNLGLTMYNCVILSPYT